MAIECLDETAKAFHPELSEPNELRMDDKPHPYIAYLKLLTCEDVRFEKFKSHVKTNAADIKLADVSASLDILADCIRVIPHDQKPEDWDEIVENTKYCWKERTGSFIAKCKETDLRNVIYIHECFEEQKLPFDDQDLESRMQTALRSLSTQLEKAFFASVSVKPTTPRQKVSKASNNTRFDLTMIPGVSARGLAHQTREEHNRKQTLRYLGIGESHSLVIQCMNLSQCRPADVEHIVKYSIELRACANTAWSRWTHSALLNRNCAYDPREVNKTIDTFNFFYPLWFQNTFHFHLWLTSIGPHQLLWNNIVLKTTVGDPMTKPGIESLIQRSSHTSGILHVLKNTIEQVVESKEKIVDGKEKVDSQRPMDRGPLREAWQGRQRSGSTQQFLEPHYIAGKCISEMNSLHEIGIPDERREKVHEVLEEYCKVVWDMEDHVQIDILRHLCKFSNIMGHGMSRTDNHYSERKLSSGTQIQSTQVR